MSGKWKGYRLLMRYMRNPEGLPGRRPRMERYHRWEKRFEAKMRKAVLQSRGI